MSPHELTRGMQCIVRRVWASCISFETFLDQFSLASKVSATINSAQNTTLPVMLVFRNLLSNELPNMLRWLLVTDIWSLIYISTHSTCSYMYDLSVRQGNYKYVNSYLRWWLLLKRPIGLGLGLRLFATWIVAPSVRCNRTSFVVQLSLYSHVGAKLVHAWSTYFFT